MNLLSNPSRLFNSSLYFSQFGISSCATPELMAALATAGATEVIKRVSNGFGIMYSFPKVIDCSP